MTKGRTISYAVYIILQHLVLSDRSTTFLGPPFRPLVLSVTCVIYTVLYRQEVYLYVYIRLLALRLAVAGRRRL
jgi:hypothetical protein